jgi:serine/threonine protein kinase, bacterial
MAVQTELPGGTRLAGYTLEAVLGRGGMSVVYAAHDERLDRRVALKVLDARVSDTVRARLLGESRLAASIDHPHVIPVYEAGEAEEGLFIAMQLVTGTDLRALLAREGTLDPPRALAILGQVASALDAAHARGLLHMDVKPANVLLAAGEGGRDHAYLTDFGLAIRADGDARLDDGRFGGSADYVAPEQIEGRPEPRSDLYSLACVLFECLTGEPPFGRRRLLEVLWCHLNEEPPLLSRRRSDLPRALDGVLAAGLAKDPEDRPSRSGELVVRARAAAGLERARARNGRRHVALAAATLALAALAAGLALGGDRNRTADGAAVPAGGMIDTLAGTGRAMSFGDGGGAREAGLNGPISVAVDRGGNVYVAEAWGNGARIRRIAPDGSIVTVAGTGTRGYSGDGGPATRAAIDESRIAVGPDGALYVLQWWIPALRRVGPDGTIETVAGTGRGGLVAPDPRTRSPDLCQRPEGPAFDAAGRVYISCPTAHRVIRLDGDGFFTTVAGTGEPGASGDGGPATQARLDRPAGLAVDAEGNLYIADSLNHRVRRVDPRGVITTVAGTGRAGLSGDGWQASSVDIWSPVAVEIDGEGNLYVVEAATHRVRRIDPSGVITTVAGSGRRGFSGDGGPARAAALAEPSDVAVDALGRIYIADTNNHRVRRVVP